MLVLSRRLRQSVVIDGRIRVTVIKTGTGAVRLGIEAPDDMSVHREEIQNRIAGSMVPNGNPLSDGRRGNVERSELGSAGAA